jgi:hypothetical protein
LVALLDGIVQQSPVVLQADPELVCLFDFFLLIFTGGKVWAAFPLLRSPVVIVVEVSVFINCLSSLDSYNRSMTG